MNHHQMKVLKEIQRFLKPDNELKSYNATLRRYRKILGNFLIKTKDIIKRKSCKMPLLF